MLNASDRFRLAVANYAFPQNEPIFHVRVFAEPAHEVILFRQSGPPSECRRDVGNFWASALFNYLEDRLSDNDFEAIGGAVEYKTISADEAEALIFRLGLSEKCFAPGAIVMPTIADPCTFIESQAGIKGLVGSDTNGCFALIWPTELTSRSS